LADNTVKKKNRNLHISNVYRVKRILSVIDHQM